MCHQRRRGVWNQFVGHRLLGDGVQDLGEWVHHRGDRDWALCMRPCVLTSDEVGELQMDAAQKEH